MRREPVHRGGTKACKNGELGRSASFMNSCRFTSNCKKRAVQPTLRVQANPSLTVSIWTGFNGARRAYLR